MVTQPKSPHTLLPYDDSTPSWQQAIIAQHDETASGARRNGSVDGVPEVGFTPLKRTVQEPAIVPLYPPTYPLRASSNQRQLRMRGLDPNIGGSIYKNSESASALDVSNSSTQGRGDLSPRAFRYPGSNYASVNSIVSSDMFTSWLPDTANAEHPSTTPDNFEPLEHRLRMYRGSPKSILQNRAFFPQQDPIVAIKSPTSVIATHEAIRGPEESASASDYVSQNPSAVLRSPSEPCKYDIEASGNHDHSVVSDFEVHYAQSSGGHVGRSHSHSRGPGYGHGHGRAGSRSQSLADTVEKRVEYMEPERVPDQDGYLVERVKNAVLHAVRAEVTAQIDSNAFSTTERINDANRVLTGYVKSTATSTDERLQSLEGTVARLQETVAQLGARVGEHDAPPQRQPVRTVTLDDSAGQDGAQLAGADASTDERAARITRANRQMASSIREFRYTQRLVYDGDAEQTPLTAACINETTGDILCCSIDGQVRIYTAGSLTLQQHEDVRATIQRGEAVPEDVDILTPHLIIKNKETCYSCAAYDVFIALCGDTGLIVYDTERMAIVFKTSFMIGFKHHSRAFRRLVFCSSPQLRERFRAEPLDASRPSPSAAAPNLFLFAMGADRIYMYDMVSFVERSAFSHTRSGAAFSSLVFADRLFCTTADGGIFAAEVPALRFEKLTQVEGVVCLASAGRTLVCGCADGQLKVVDTQTKAVTHVLRGHKAPVCQVYASDLIIVACDTSGYVSFWERAAAISCLQKLKIHDSEVSSLMVSLRRIVTSSLDGFGNCLDFY